MLGIAQPPASMCDGVSRREAIRLGGLTSLGFSLPQLLQLRSGMAQQPGSRSKRRARPVRDPVLAARWTAAARNVGSQTGCTGRHSR
jgi:hypothetical protein